MVAGQVNLRPLSYQPDGLVPPCPGWPVPQVFPGFRAFAVPDRTVSCLLRLPDPAEYPVANSWRTDSRLASDRRSCGPHPGGELASHDPARVDRLVRSRSVRAMNERARVFTTTVVQDAKRRVMVPLPFAPNDVWGAKPTHPLAGTVNGMSVRAAPELIDVGWAILLGPAWRRDCGVGVGDEVDVVLFPEGPQRDDLAADIAAALHAEPDAAAFFDGLAQFYREAYLRWIDATKRRPELRGTRIAEVVALLKSGIKQRPR